MAWLKISSGITLVWNYSLTIFIPDISILESCVTSDGERKVKQLTKLPPKPTRKKHNKKPQPEQNQNKK